MMKIICKLLLLLLLSSIVVLNVDSQKIIKFSISTIIMIFSHGLIEIPSDDVRKCTWKCWYFLSSLKLFLTVCIVLRIDQQPRDANND